MRNERNEGRTDTPQSTATNGIIALLLLLATSVLAALLLALWLGPTRWPLPLRKRWESMPEQWRTVLLRIAYMPITWLLVGIIVGSSLINPMARWLRALLP